MGQKSTEFDIHISKKLKVRRISLGISCETMSKKLGVSYQQITKYQNGTTRISSGKLWEIAKILRTPITYFFEDIDNSSIAFKDVDIEELKNNTIMNISKNLNKVNKEQKTTISQIIKKIVELIKNNKK